MITNKANVISIDSDFGYRSYNYGYNFIILLKLLFSLNSSEKTDHKSVSLTKSVQQKEAVSQLVETASFIFLFYSLREWL